MLATSRDIPYLLNLTATSLGGLDFALSFHMACAPLGWSKFPEKGLIYMAHGESLSFCKLYFM